MSKMLNRLGLFLGLVQAAPKAEVVEAPKPTAPAAKKKAPAVKKKAAAPKHKK